MNPDDFEKLPIIGLGKTAYNDPTSYTELQKALWPYIDYYHELLWLLFFGTLFFLLFKFLLRPIYQNIKGGKK